MDAKLDMIVALAKDEKLRCDDYRVQESSFSKVGLALPNYTKIVWDAACVPTEIKCEWGVDLAQNVTMDAADIHGVAVNADASCKWTEKTRMWTGCRFMSLNGSRMFWNDVTCYPPRLRVLDLSLTIPNLGGVDFKLLDTACPDLELLILPNTWKYFCESEMVWDDFFGDGNRTDDPFDCYNIDYLNTAKERSYAVYWADVNPSDDQSTFGEYWAPHTVRHPRYFPNWREILAKKTEIVEKIRSTFPDFEEIKSE